MYHFFVRFSIVSLFFVLSTLSLFAQSGYDWYLNYIRSNSAYGLGEQGVASRSGIDAMIYNPANLIHTEGTQLSYFRNPFYYAGWDDTPFKSYAVTTKLDSNIYLGAEFVSWDFYLSGITIANNENGYVENSFHSYNRTFAISFAQRFSDELGYGVQVRYTKDNSDPLRVEHFWGSAGIQYIPSTFDHQLRVGFSLMNFTTSISIPVTDFITGNNFVEHDPPSSYVRLGFEYDIIHNSFFTLTLHEETSKELIKYNSSFEALFNDWHDAPRDVDLHSGLSFAWNPIPLGKGYSLIETMYFGHLTYGPLSGSGSKFYNGINFGIGVGGVQFLAGYASMWHMTNTDIFNIFFNQMPWETFQFTIKSNASLLHFEPEKESPSPLNRIILSIGWGYPFRTGWYGEHIFARDPHDPSQFATSKYFNRALYQVEASFYFSERSALVTSFQYGRIPVEYNAYAVFFAPPPTHFGIAIRIETLTLISAYRYHPISDFQPAFIEVGFGVQRQNPIEDTSPKYFYNPLAMFNGGVLIPFSNIMLIPKVGFSSLLGKINGSAPRLGGYNQFEFSVNAGYSFE